MSIKSKAGFREDVPVSLIFMEASYGRLPSETHVSFLADHWDRAKANVILLSLRGDGTFACLDGWHRVLACRRAEGEAAKVRADILIDLSLEDEAAYFVAYNRDRRRLTPYEIFRARLAQGEVRAHAIQATVNGTGLRLSGERRAGAVRAIKAIERVYEAGGAPLLTASLSTLKRAWENGHYHDRDPYTEPAVEGMAQFFLRYPNVNMHRLINALQELGPIGMKGEMFAVRKVLDTKPALAWGRALHHKYNVKTRSGRLPEWVDRIMTPGGKERKRKQG